MPSRAGAKRAAAKHLAVARLSALRRRRNKATVLLRARYSARTAINGRAMPTAIFPARPRPNLARVRTSDPAIMESEMKRLIYAVAAISALGLGAGNLAIAADNEEQSGTTVQAPSDESAPAGNVVKDDDNSQQGSDTKSDDEGKK
jgi:hypothetical protein